MRRAGLSLLFLISLSAFPLLLLGGGLFLCARTSGFSIDKITSRFPYNSLWEIAPISEKQEELLMKKVFPQTYYYLASGDQCYTFISEDREYVLKFFKAHQLFPKEWLRRSPFAFIKKLGFKTQASNQLFSERIFASYKDAYEALADETGLIYIHLNKTKEVRSKVTLVDSKGKKHLVDLEKFEFAVQKRARRMFGYLKELVDAHREEDLKSSIRSFLHLVTVRCDKGFGDQRFDIRHQFGFIGNKAVQFDCATLMRDSSMRYPQNFRKEVLEAAERLDVWARKVCPEMTLFIQQEAQLLINESAE